VEYGSGANNNLCEQILIQRDSLWFLFAVLTTLELVNRPSPESKNPNELAEMHYWSPLGYPMCDLAFIDRFCRLKIIPSNQIRVDCGSG